MEVGSIVNIEEEDKEEDNHIRRRIREASLSILVNIANRRSISMRQDCKI